MKQIVISRNSIWALLYRFFYRSDLPKGLCNLFWANIIALILLIPYTLYVLPVLVTMLLVRLFSKESREETFIYQWEDFFYDWFYYFAGGFFGWAATGFLFAFFNGLYYLLFVSGYQADEVGFYVIGSIILIGIIIWFFKEKVSSWYKQYRKDLLIKNAQKWYDNLPEGEDKDSAKYDIIYYYEHRDVSNWFTVSREAIISFYKKNCPRIQWN